MGLVFVPLHLGAESTPAPSAAAARQTTAAAGGQNAPAAGATAGTGLQGTAPATGVAGPLATSAASMPAPTKPPSSGAGRIEGSGAISQAQLAKLPPITGTDIDVAKRSATVVAHLNAILRFYRAVTVPVQKVGEPSDVLYAEQIQTEATQIAELAFQAAKNEAALLSKVPGAANAKSGAPAPAQNEPPQSTESERIATVRAQAQSRLSDLQTQQTALQGQIARARGEQRATLTQTLEQVEGGIELQQAMVDALGRINSFSQTQAQTGLAGDIDRLQRSAPELLSNPIKTPPPPVLESLASTHDAGVSSQAAVLFQLLSARHTIEQQIETIDLLNKQATDLRTPFVKAIRSTVAQGQALTQQTVNLQATPTTDAQDLANTRKQFSTLASTFEALASATLPLSQEAVLLENARGTLTTWRATVDAEYDDILRHLLIRVVVIAVALGLLAFANRLLKQAAVKYVNDLRRRRHLIVVRRFVFGFLTGLVLIFGFVTQFSSLATFAGFISAGIAVGLQSILLSVAAYFFIVGRYGVRVGDRITVAGVTGEVIEVGLARFYMMELVGTGTELHSTGRVAVFANSVLFQTGTPIYKQMPGTEYAWHELTTKLKGDADPHAAANAIQKAVESVYAGYRERIERQHQQVEAWMGTALPAPKIESRLQLVEAGLQFAVLFPVEIQSAAETDQQVIEALLNGMRTEGPLKAGVADLPVIKAAVKS